MLKKHRNVFLEIIKNSEFNENSFRSREGSVGDFPCFIIELQNTPLKFYIRNTKESFYDFDCKYVQLGPGFPESVYSPKDDFTNDFNYICRLFEDWLNRDVKDYLDELMEPDYWRQINEQDDFISGALISEDDTSSFSGIEKDQLKLSINELKLLIVNNFQPSNEQLNVIDARLQYLSNSLDRLNKIDWRGLALSTMLGISIALSLDTEKGKVLFGLFKKVFTSVLHLLQ